VGFQDAVMEHSKINIKKTLGPKESKAAGLNHLSDDEVRKLNAALSAHRKDRQKESPSDRGLHRLHMKTTLTPEEFKAAGLKNLTGDQLKALDGSFNEHSADLGQGPRPN